MNQSKRIFIAEDEVMIAEQLKDMLLEMGYEVGDIGFDMESSIRSIEKDTPDIAILDVKMHGSDRGFEIAAFINENYAIPVVFLTSFADRETVLKAATFNPAGYLVKPFTAEDIYTTVEITLRNHAPPPATIIVNTGYSDVKLSADEILWIRSEDKYIEIYTADKKYVQRCSLFRFLEDSSDAGFQRVHRSYAVNPKKVREFNGNFVTVATTRIPVSRKYKASIREWFLG